MNIEIEYAVNYLAGTIQERLSGIDESKIEMLRVKLTGMLCDRFENHWYPDKPLKGSAYRCVNINKDDNSVDTVLRRAISESNISMDELLQVFSHGLALWIDPNDVSCRLGKGAIFPIYRKIADNSNRAGSPPLGHRPQQRPRSKTPPNNTYNTGHRLQRSRSTTPPGFSSMDAGQLFQSIPAKPSYSAENLHKLWDTIPNTTNYSQRTTSSTLSYTSPSSTSSAFSYSPNDAVYSFNQYSSYYKPNSTYWKKNYQSNKPMKPLWQNDDVYQRYHWSRNENSGSTAGNNVAFNKFNNYGYQYAQHAQEVC